MRKFLKICLVVILVSLILLSAYSLVIYYIIMPIPTKNSLNRNLNKNYDENMYFIDYVRDIGESENYESIWFSQNYDDSWDMLVYYDDHDFENIPIQDKDLVNMIENLLEHCNYNRISYTTSYIYFQSKYGTTMDSAYGVVYSFDGKIPDFEDVVEIEPLDKPNWYYYYSDYNLYKEGQYDGKM